MTWTHAFARGRVRRLAFAAGALAAGLTPLAVSAPASAATNQIAIIQDGNALKTDPAGTIAQFRELGAQEIRLLIMWNQVAPSPKAKQKPKFTATNPGAYPASNWAIWDTIIQDATNEGMKVDLDITGAAPAWANGKGAPSNVVKDNYSWNPSATDYGQFVAAVAQRYDGRYTPKGATSALPKVTTFSLWNEPNFGQDLGPQAVGATSKFDGYLVAPGYYRNLLRAAYPQVKKYDPSATIVIGELAGQGKAGVKNRIHPQGLPGNFSITSPIPYLQTLYCVNSNYQKLTGKAAAEAQCPASGANAAFVKSNPALFSASAISSHPYNSQFAPNSTKGIGAQAIVLPVINRMETEMKKLSSHYGKGRSWPIYSTEYGYITNPPKPHIYAPYPSPTVAAQYLNEAEYDSYQNPNVKSFAQYLLRDPASVAGTGLFASGLLFANGRPKPSFNAYRLPIWVPNGTAVKPNSSTKVWGGARPAVYGYVADHTAQQVAIQYEASNGSSFSTLATVTTNRTTGYFSTSVKIPASGQLRLAYTYPTDEPFLPVGIAGSTVYSRDAAVTVK